jgi:hypothetical protein
MFGLDWGYISDIGLYMGYIYVYLCIVLLRLCRLNLNYVYAKSRVYFKDK